ncbi:adenosylmethionine--8-amino-7-oxononanoate transaminase [Bartonella sp. A05]|uniref:adenosylmethionine--8-amino-7-oxononanoate transaminase n=1 Tax=Bartonella sp. A05 TaxID=2967261 RepID=UPI0022A8E91B|nr:adenosylmethionine--8-amino-7-oxononanoate transaminase [Bartonella sp. A05]MCZ2204443.1 adenosylmethionine--8-amino-7-oxononanoate transaminase [Bartonella sp. A05]
MTISERDKRIIWHPFTQEKTAPEIISIKRALGSYLYDEKDKAYLDLISSWWVNIHGHAHPEIAKSIYKQANTLEHVIFAGFTHEPAVNLCEDLQSLLPPDLCKFFFSDNGSTAVEVALKMAYQYWRNLGRYEKITFLSFDGGYHGDTFGAMSVGAKSGFHNQFNALFFNVLSVPYPDTWNNDDEVESKEQKSINALKHYLNDYHHKIAAIILEPLIQGASGMRVCRPQFIKEVIDLVRQNNILVIFDEIMTGFGRTGSYFAYQQLGVIPDFLCLSKGITGGFLPLALTITNNQIYEAFLGDDFNTAFAHGHSYTANPLACSAAITSLRLLKSSKCQDFIKNINEMHKKEIELLKLECPRVEKTRVIGTIAAFDLKNSAHLMPSLKQLFFQEGILLRPLGNTVYLLPPYCITNEEVELVYSKIIKIINSL